MSTSEITLSSSQDMKSRSGNWSSEKQIVGLLELCEAQIGSAMHDAATAIDTLLHAFNGVSETSRSLSTATNHLADRPDSPTMEDLHRGFGAIRSQMNMAVIGLQFHDKLTQRLDHVRHSLLRLATFIGDHTRSSQVEQWNLLLTDLRRLYRTEEERRIFKCLMEDADSNEAIEQRNDIELF